jgi:hypothetical protein
VPSAARALVAISSVPAKLFSRLDLPTPDEPSSTAVRPGSSRAARASRPFAVTFDTGYTGTPIATLSTASTAAGTSSQRSVFVRTTRGSAPLSHAVAT